MIFGTKLFRRRSQKLLNVGAGAKKLRCPELEPSLKFEYGLQTLGINYSSSWEK